MKIIFVFVAVLAIVLNLSFDVVNCDLRFRNDLPGKPSSDQLGGKSHGSPVNANFDTYPKPPHGPNGPIASRTTESRSTNRHQIIEKGKCGNGPRPPHGPDSHCGPHTNVSPGPVNTVGHVFPHGPNDQRQNPTGRGELGKYPAPTLSNHTPQRPHGPSGR